jgi:basic membrane protein A
MTGRMYEVMYLAGMAAGAVTRTHRIGCVMLKPHPTVRAMCNALALGAARTNPQAVVLVINIDSFQDSYVMRAWFRVVCIVIVEV